jgi:hypothetical protein
MQHVVAGARLLVHDIPFPVPSFKAKYRAERS